MHFDDRLATALSTRPGGDVAARTQYRQLLDLLGTLPADARSDQIDAAFLRLGELSSGIDGAERAAIIATSGLRLRSPRLIAQLANDDPAIAAAALTRARLDQAQWLDLIPVIPAPVRHVLRTRSDLPEAADSLLTRLGVSAKALPPVRDPQPVAANDGAPIRLHPASAIGAAPSQPAATAAPLPPREGIGAIVQRIEAYRRRQAEVGPAAGAPLEAAPPAASRPALPLTAVDFATDETGRIVWSDSVAAPAVVGLTLRREDTAGTLQHDPLGDAMRRRQPLHALLIELPGAAHVSGAWQVDAMPQFDSLGRFTGYLGRLRRPAAPTADAAAPSEADRLRQLLHELRTPVNAIQGFAEVIQQQLFGPTPNEYRAHAAAIAGDAARILAGFDELDRLARLDTGALRFEPGESDLAAIVQAIVIQLSPHLLRRNAALLFPDADQSMPVALGHSDAERLCWRLIAAVAANAGPGEQLRLRLRRKQGAVRLNLYLPASLAAAEDVFHADPSTGSSPITAGMFGTGFALRLASSESRAAGGSLVRNKDRLRLELPCAEDCLTDDSQPLNQRQGLSR